MSFGSRNLIAGVIAAIGGIVAFISVQSIVNDFLDTYALLIALSGVLLLFFHKKVSVKTGISSDVLKTIATTLLFLSIKGVITPYIVGVWSYFALSAGLVLIVLRDNIAKMLNGG